MERSATQLNYFASSLTHIAIIPKLVIVCWATKCLRCCWKVLSASDCRLEPPVGLGLMIQLVEHAWVLLIGKC
jgi:hypothetical protein